MQFYFGCRSDAILYVITVLTSDTEELSNK